MLLAPFFRLFPLCLQQKLCSQMSDNPQNYMDKYTMVVVVEEAEVEEEVVMVEEVVVMVVMVVVMEEMVVVMEEMVVVMVMAVAVVVMVMVVVVMMEEVVVMVVCICDGILKSRGQTVQGQLKGMSAEAEIQL